ncbi:MAG: lysyl oxidase family protein [Candidatus Paceibacterota bacterium]
MIKKSLTIGISLVIFAIVSLGVLFMWGNQTVSFERGEEEITMVTFTIPETGMNRLAVAEIIISAFGWDKERIRPFASTYAQVQWAALNGYVTGAIGEEFELDEDDERELLANSTLYLQPQYDFLGTVHATGTYEISQDATEAMVADLLVSRVAKETNDPIAFIEEHLDTEAVVQVISYVRGEQELLPDLVPLPPQDLVIDETKNGVLLSFSTIYYNQGTGPLELRADSETADVEGDVERAVFQRIYRGNGTYRDREAGVFLWHQPHLHYHFADFVLYDLKAVDASDAPDLSGTQQKSTFCIRDVSRVSINLQNTPSEAGYKICGRERQGISVGWGDTYFYTYPDQNLNISGLPSGTYRLTFIVNPEDRFDEVTKSNNTASALIELDMEEKKVRIVETEPSDTPRVEHIYEEQVFE